jgi:hypothetical protein
VLVSCFGRRKALLSVLFRGGFVILVFADTIFQVIIYETVFLLVFKSLGITLHSFDPHRSRMIAKGAQ